MADDRRTSIENDQIADYTIGSDEINTDKQTTSRKKWMVLMFKQDDNGQMMWGFPFGNKILK